LLTNRNRTNLGIVAQGKYLPSLKEAFSMLLTFSLTVLAWIFFRAENIEHAINYISGILSSSLFTIPVFTGLSKDPTTIIMILFFIIIEWVGREHEYAIAHLGIKLKRPVRWVMYYAIILAIFYFGGKEQQFIYFQF
jgi:hypothetical protein